MHAWITDEVEWIFAFPDLGYRGNYDFRVEVQVTAWNLTTAACVTGLAVPSRMESLESGM
jgi:hypothetical protein